jgi:hypothetical protein
MKLQKPSRHDPSISAKSIDSLMHHIRDAILVMRERNSATPLRELP